MAQRRWEPEPHPSTAWQPGTTVRSATGERTGSSVAHDGLSRETRTLLREAGDVEGWKPVASACAGMPAPRVLLIDDYPQAGAELAEPLAAAGFAVLRVHRARTALEVLDHEQCDVVLVDAEPAGMSGFQVCREVRRRSDVPLLFLSASGTLAERLLAFDLGADDYIARPAAVEEVERRMRAVLRRARPDVGRVSLDGPSGLQLSLLEHVLRVHGIDVAATPKEFDLLRLLLERRGEVLTTDAISQAVWGYETMGSRNFVEAHVSRLRSKLGAAGACGVIETVRGVGYVIR